MNLGDPELELIDPTPNVHCLFLQFDSIFFGAKLASRAVVRWSKRMYSCAGICSYEGRGGLCDIALSEPLLKLRPRKDIVETLLHEMIHAYLFITNRDRDRDGHGPNFKAHMHRINQSAGLNISIYHDFHDEVNLYLTHVWRCNGPCQKTRPHFGMVRRSANRAPCERDYWWEDHKRRCGGTFIKIKEPEKPAKKNAKVIDKPLGDITKYITTKSNTPQITKPAFKDQKSVPGKTKSSGSLVLPKKGPILNPQIVNPPVVFSGKGQTLAGGRLRSGSVGVLDTVRNVWATKNVPSVSSPTISPKSNSPLETVRNIWAKKQLPETPTAACIINPGGKKSLDNTVFGNNSKIVKRHKIDSHADSPPAKINKIDDYFKTTASNILKDVYGKGIEITQTDKDKKFVVIAESSSHIIEKSPDPGVDGKICAASNQDLVDCPVCSSKISSLNINNHLDECLNREIIANISKETDPPLQTPGPSTNRKSLKGIYGNITPNPAYNPNNKSVENMDNMINERISGTESTNVSSWQNVGNENVQEDFNTAVSLLDLDILNEPDILTKKINNAPSSNPENVDELKMITFDKYVGTPDNYVVPKQEETEFEPQPSFLDGEAYKVQNPLVKIEPGTSKAVAAVIGQKCACCGMKIDKPMGDHLDECLAFFTNNNTIPNEGASTSFADGIIVIDDDEDDIFDESQIFNATGTKTPCPCCLEMIEEAEMNDHIDRCLSTDD